MSGRFAGTKMRILSRLFGGSGNKIPAPEVCVNEGIIRGKNFTIDGNRIVRGFLGVPFAKPPVGELRFEKPQPPESWSGVRECVKHASKAEQKELFLEKFIFSRVGRSEDCLYLNLFVPAWEPPPSQKNGFAVMVFIHGGAFAVHSSCYYGDIGICRHLCEKDVIVVTLQYRLGILGFAATGDSTCTPNLGLWDQTRALIWIYENIPFFGGNPENVTIFGQSAGGASVDYLIMSPHSNRFFQKAIPMGGSAYCPWAGSNEKSIRDAIRFRARHLGWRAPHSAASETEKNESLMEFLRSQTGRKLGIEVCVLGKGKNERSLFGVDFAPVMGDEFLPGTYYELHKNAPKKRCIAGVTECEGLLFAAYRERNYSVQNMRKWIARTFRGLSPRQRDTVAELYVRGDETNDQQTRAFVQFYGDLLINNGIYWFAEDMVDAGHTVYLYNFEFCPRSLGPLGWALPFRAATHGTELPYLFGKPIVTNYKFHDSDKRMLDVFSKMFTNFAKFDDPNVEGEPTWEPLTSSERWRYMNVNEVCEMRDNFKDRRASVWNKFLTEITTSESDTTQTGTPSPSP